MVETSTTSVSVVARENLMRSRPQPKCPIRGGEPCSLCFPGADGPQNCGLVYLVQADPEMREEWAATVAERRASSST